MTTVNTDAKPDVKEPHSAEGDRLTQRPGEARCPMHEFASADGMPGRADQRLVVRSYDLARQVLKLKDGTRQAGFNADLLLSNEMLTKPMLYSEGTDHRDKRRLAAQYFTPKAVSTKHHQMIVEVCDALISDLEQRGGGAVDQLSFTLAMRVVCEVVGLTESDQSAMEKLLDGYFREPVAPGSPRYKFKLRSFTENIQAVRFFVRHVRPAMQARKRQPQDDVVTALMERGTKERDILIECLTYAAAGMVTTRQFISLCVWQFLKHPELKERFLAAETPQRRRILAEMVRLDSVASNLLRLTTDQVTLTTSEGELVVPSNTLIDVQLRMANTDEVIFGSDAMCLNPDRVPAQRVPDAGLSFGEGIHSCPGEHLAMEETDLFLLRFFQQEWKMIGEPTVTWNDVVQAFDIHNLVVQLVT